MPMVESGKFCPCGLSLWRLQVTFVIILLIISGLLFQKDTERCLSVFPPCAFDARIDALAQDARLILFVANRDD